MLKLKVKKAMLATGRWLVRRSGLSVPIQSAVSTVPKREVATLIVRMAEDGWWCAIAIP